MRSRPSWIAETRRFAWGLAGGFSLLLLLLGLTGYWYLAQRQEAAQAEAHQQLSAIADLKLKQISTWREERLADARFFSHARFVAQDVQRFLEQPGVATNRLAVEQWLNLLKGGDRYYGVALFDRQGEQRLSLPAGLEEPADSVRRLLASAWQNRSTVMSDLHQDQTNGPVHLDILFPVFKEADFQQGELLGAVLLRLDARQFLFPLLQSWPTPSETAETLLVRQEGQTVLFLSDLRHQPGAAMALRLPLSRPNLVAARVLRGETRVLEATDYRGVPVVAAGRLIPGTTWAMIAKMDRREVYAPVRQQLGVTVVVLGVLALAGLLLGALLWRQRVAKFLQRELALEKERAALAERVALLMRHANDIIILMKPDGQILEANEYALKHYGYSLAEMRQKTLRDLRAPEARARLEQDLQQVNTEGALFLETLHQRKDGSQFPVEVSSRKIQVGAEPLIFCILRDITERRTHAREIERLNRLYAALSQVNEAVVRSASRAELLREVCRVLVEFGGLQMSWIGWVEEASARVVPLADYGDRTGYLHAVQIFADERPEGCGPVGTAIRENRTCVCDEVATAPQMRPWHAAAARAGWCSLAAFPIRQEGRARGALAVYARTCHFFGPQEQQLVEEAAASLAFGLESLRREQRRQEAEAALRQSRNDLERLVQERTAQLVEANANLQSFAHSAAHDLRSPLRGISSFASVALEEYGPKLDDMGRSLLQRVVDSAGLMGRLLNDLLEYSKLTQAELPLKPVSLEEAMREVLALLEEDIQTRQAVLEVAPGLPQVIGHPATVVMLISNLVSNALKFMPPGARPHIRLWAEPVPPAPPAHLSSLTSHPSARFVRLNVQDNGIGLAPENLGKMFTPFQRLNSKQAYPGTGLGLAIVRKGAERMGGRVGVESEVGKGSRFWVELQAVSEPVGSQ